jgi:acyl-CoA thioester hydrolase
MASALKNRDWKFSIPVQINYQDTDAGGVVYYGNYLGFMERARNGYLRKHGFPLRTLEQQHKIIFVVTHADLNYLLPARLDDEIEITLRVLAVSGAAVIIEHWVICEEKKLVHGEIKLVTINKDSFKPCRIPADLKSVFSENP